MSSLEILEFKQSIREFVFRTPIDEEVKRMVLEDILNEQANIAAEKIREEIRQREEASKLQSEDFGGTENGDAESA